MYDELVIQDIQRKQSENEERPFLELPLPEVREPVETERIKEPKRVIIIDLNSDTNNFEIDI